MNQKSENSAEIRMIASEKQVEGDAVRQLQNSAGLTGMELVVGLPDLHPGKGYPIGAAFISREWIYPYLVGNDIGCGMGFWKTSLKKKKIKRDRWTDKLHGLETPWEGDRQAWVEKFGLKPCEADIGLGTIGGGNHFAELQVVESVENPDSFKRLGLSKDRLFLLVHSGSRGLGESILHNHIQNHKAAGLPIGTEDAIKYLNAHDTAMQWAVANRTLIAERFLSTIRAAGEQLVTDLHHNGISPVEFQGTECWLHRKGATPSNRGVVVIPGTRGSFTYLVEPIGDQEKNAWSLAHGSGRKWKRSETKARLKSRFKAKSLTHTELGGRVICENRDVLYEEAPQAYKNIDHVTEQLVQAGLIRVIALFRPLITYKMRNAR